MKKTFKVFWSVSLGVAWLVFMPTACEKGYLATETFAQGTVISFYDSSKVVPSATVYLHRGQDRDIIDSTKTDADGKFRIDFTTEKNIMYGITAKEERYFESSKNYFFISPQTPSMDKMKIAAYPKSYVRVRIQDDTRTKYYAGIRLRHTAFTNYTIIKKSPIMDTTVVVDGYYENDIFSWGFINYDGTWQSRNSILFNTPTPFDTFNLSIKF
jgi:hypothetical protein